MKPEWQKKKRKNKPRRDKKTVIRAKKKKPAEGAAALNAAEIVAVAVLAIGVRTMIRFVESWAENYYDAKTGPPTELQPNPETGVYEVPK